jgi:GT2 family glycosyltransferase
VNGESRVGVIGGLILAGDCHDKPDAVATRSVTLPMIDATGLRLSWQGRLVEWRLEYETRARKVFGVTGACPLFTRPFYEDIAVDGMVYDERYHAYAEDIDLFIRARTNDWSVVYDPAIRAYHWGSMSTGGKRRIFHKPPALQQQVFRNMTWNILKNFTALELLLYFPVHVLNVVLVSGWAVVSRSGMSLRSVLGGYVTEPLRGLSATIATRRQVQTRPWYNLRLLGDMLLRRPR